jgi:hypothetical protein
MRKYSKGYLAFTQGKFDEWAVYVKYPNFPEWPTDKWYFIKLRVYQQYVGKAAYEDFCGLYDKTTADVSNEVFDWIDEVTAKYPNPEEASVVFGIYYMTMIAEENKEFAVLKKRIKRLGVHQVLVEGLKPELAANFSKGRPAWELVHECHDRGF